jgi:hypothetical protein
MRVPLAACAVFFFASLPAWALPPAPLDGGSQLVIRIGDDQGDIQGIIRDQIEAFRHDDGATAYSFAAPSLKLYFPTAEGFMAMVRNGYRPIYRAQRFSFGPLKQADGKFEQTVELVGPDGDYWQAIYTFVRQEDGSLKIVSCYLVKAATA